MRINNREEDHITIDDSGAKLTMEACMGAIADILIYPKMEEEMLSTNDSQVLELVGSALKTIAMKAQAYEDVFENGTLPENYRN
jgi:hypothetical protein